MLIPIVVIIALIVVAVMAVAGPYNALVTLRQRYKNAFAQIDVQLKRRYDLIPNLVETAKGYMKHERETLEAVVAARNPAVTATRAALSDPGGEESMASFNRAEGNLGGAMRRMMLLVENYPDLKASQNMLALQEELASTENKVSFARQSYNDAVTAYNTKREVFPTNIVARFFNFGPAVLFEVTDAVEREAPKVQF
ncbi:MAG: LemA family protein [Kiritimatiellae bacterium]|nr:LemA family protein [Kiritimatiellia bacterium]